MNLFTFTKQIGGKQEAMHTPPRALLLALDHFISNCHVLNAQLEKAAGVIKYTLFQSDTVETFTSVTGKDIVVEFEGERGLSLLQNFLTISMLAGDPIPEEIESLTENQINNLVHMCIAKLDLERKLSESISFADTEKTGDKEVLIYATDDKQVKVDLDTASKLSVDLLLTSYLLRRGYTVHEVIGDHILVYTPAGGKRVIDETGCDCMEYSLKNGRERCAHMVFSDSYMRQRKAFQKGRSLFSELINNMKA